jgi:hypothetical protein
MGSEGRAIIDRIKVLLGKEWAICLINDVGIKKATAYSWDANESPPKAPDLYRIAKYLKTTVEELVDGEVGEQ